MTEFGLNRFDPLTLKIDNVAVFIAKRGSGKSTVCEDLLYNIRYQIPLIIIISPTEKTDPFFSRFVPEAFIYDDLDLDALKEILRRNKEVKKNPPPGLENPAVLIIMDDCMYKKTLFNAEIIRYLIQNGRHDDIGLWIITQYAADLPRYIRTNVDIVFAFKDNARVNRENLYKMFFGVVDTFKEFDHLCQFYTADRGILVLDNRDTSSDLKKKLFWYKAKWNAVPPPEKKNWRFGPLANDMYAFNDKHYLESTSESVDWSSYKMSSIRTSAGHAKKSEGQVVLRRLGTHGEILE